MSARQKLAAIGVAALLLALFVAYRQFRAEPLNFQPERPEGRPDEVEPNIPEPLPGDGPDRAGTSNRGDPPEPASPEAPGDRRFDPVGTPTDRPGEVRGTVVSEEGGGGIAGARVVLKFDFTRNGGRWPKEGKREFELVTDDRGGFRYEAIPPGVYELRIEHDDYAPRVLTGVTLAEGAGLEGLDVDLLGDLRKLGSVEGLVLDIYGSPVVGAGVVVHSAGTGGKAATETNETGAYRVERLLPGYYSVSLTGPAGEDEPQRLWGRTLPATIAAGRTVRVDFRGSGTLTGLVLDAEEKPLAGAMVILEPVKRAEGAAVRRVNTAEDGTFRIEDAGLGLHRVTVGAMSPGWFSIEAATVDLGGSDQEIRIRLEAGEIAGKLLLEDGSPPFTRGLYPSIMLFPAEGTATSGSHRYVANAMPDAAGNFRFRGLSAAKVRLRTFATGYTCPVQEVELGWSEKKEGVMLILRRLVTGRLEVKILDAEGSPVEGVVLNYSSPGEGGRGVHPSHPEPGRYVSDTVEAGSWTLHVSRPGLTTKRVPIVVKEGKTTSVTVQLD